MTDAKVIAYMAKIGAEGGSKRANHPDRAILAREAARISWMPEARELRAKRKLLKAKNSS